MLESTPVKTCLLLAVLLGSGCGGACENVVTSEVPVRYWCEEGDKNACESHGSEEPFPIYFEKTYHKGKTCADIGYATECPSSGDGEVPYDVFISNADCDPYQAP